jgi:site-specific recombinase XerD
MGKAGRVRVTGPLAPYAASFEKSLADRGYKAKRGQLYLMAQLSRWLGHRGLDGCDLAPALADAFVAERRLSAPSRHISVRRLGLLVEHLVGSGVIATWERAPDSSPTEVLLSGYSRYLLEERGLCRASLRHYVGVARSFLGSLPGDGGPGLEGLGAREVTAFVLAECQRCKTGSAKAMTTRLRSFLRYLFVEGLVPAALAGAVPSVAHWRLSSLPKALGPGQVERLLASCDRRSSTGRRDFAVITLLWRLGLRASEAAGLVLDDVDWAAGELVVRGKGGRQDRLPLPVDVGGAVVAWLQRGRPRSEHRAVFLRVRPPIGPLSPSSTSAIVHHACERAGVPVANAHRLRHTCACELLQAGGSLAEVGEILRHGQSAATSTYAKVDRRALAAVVRPWPGRAR